MMNCPQCGNSVQPGDAFCDNCGTALGGPPAAPPHAPSAMDAGSGLACPSCGAAVIAGEAFCDNCGAALDQPPPAPVGGTGTQLMPETPAPPPPVAPVGAAGPTCPQCGAAGEAGSAFCDSCGYNLSGAAPPPVVPPVQQPDIQPPSYPPTQQPVPPPVQQPEQPLVHPAYPPPVSAPAARLVLQNTNVTLPFPQGITQVTVGREDPVSNHFPEIDLTDHGGDEGGVSRRHAQFIFVNGMWHLEDLNSVNGSWVNPRTTRQRLQPGQPWPLNNGDQVRFGRVVLAFYV